MLKTVTCSLATVSRVAADQGISVAQHNLDGNADVLVRRVSDKEVAVHGRTLEGQLFLSLLVAGHFG
jgi:hypothetical protein